MKAVFKDRRLWKDRRSGNDRRTFSDPRYARPGTAQSTTLREAFERATKLRPHFAEIWYRKGDDFVQHQRYDDAKKAFNQAIIIKPTLASAWFRLAGVYSIEENRPLTLSHLKKAIELDETYKKEANKDRNFEGLWDDEEFQGLTE